MAKVVLSNNLVASALTNSEVLKTFPSLKRFAEAAKTEKKSCCGSSNQSVVQRARESILNMPSNDQKKLKELLGFNPTQVLTTFVRDEKSKLVKKDI